MILYIIINSKFVDNYINKINYFRRKKVKAKKILTALLLILLVGFNCLLSACSLVTLNNQKYLSQVVAETTNVKITMEDLILGYNSFGYSYVQNNSYTTEQAVKKTLEDLIDRELLYNKAKFELGDLTISEQNEVRKEVFDYINSQVKTYADEIIKSENLVLPETKEDKATEEATKFTAYEKKIVREKNSDGTYTYKRVVEERKNEDTKLNEFSLNEYGIEGLAQRAYSKYISKTKKSRDEYKNLSNEEVFEKEFNRIYKVYEKNKYLTLFQSKIENNAEIDLIAIKDKYIELVKNSAFTYALDENGYNKQMQSASNEVYYQPFGEKYIEVAHVLLGYNDEQTAELKKLKSDLSQGYIDVSEYELKVKNLAGAIKVKDNLNKDAQEKTVEEVYSEIASSLNACGNDNDKRVKTFIGFIEKYNTDPGMLTSLNNQTQYYAINLDTTVTDTMVKEFADASREMYSQENSDYTIYAKPVLTEYGYHIIFSLGVVENKVNLSNIDNVSVSYLYENEAMKGTNKSLFDKMAEIVDTSKYAEYQVSLISGLRDGLTITYNKTAYQRLYK